MAKKDQERNGLYFFVDSSGRLWVQTRLARAYADAYGTNNSMKCAQVSGAMRVEYKSVKLLYNWKTSFRVPGQTPGLVHKLGGPLVSTDRRNRRHSLWLY